ncbi:hypothetical protein [Streptomyces sp. NPDC048462]|uniref:hypothetical protein n=1 Tax=Streptomyces sp. NPDC048462 TaxID=3365555 RepID=UPI00370FC299
MDDQQSGHTPNPAAPDSGPQARHGRARCRRHVQAGTGTAAVTLASVAPAHRLLMTGRPGTREQVHGLIAMLAAAGTVGAAAGDVPGGG